MSYICFAAVEDANVTGKPMSVSHIQVTAADGNKAQGIMLSSRVMNLTLYVVQA